MFAEWFLGHRDTVLMLKVSFAVCCILGFLGGLRDVRE